MPGQKVNSPSDSVKSQALYSQAQGTGGSASTKEFKSYGSLSSSVLKTGVIDVSGAANSAQALLMVEDTLTLILETPEVALKTVDLNSGHLLLTRAVLSKIGLLIRKRNLALNAVYSKVPQTQQAALDEGFFVRETPNRPSLSSLEQLHQHLDKQDLQNKQSTPILDLNKTAAKSSSTIDDEIFQAASQQLQTFVEEQSKHKSSNAVFSIPDIEDHATAKTEINLPGETIAQDPLFDVASKSIAPQTVIASAPAVSSSTLLVKGTLRSGQVLRYEGNLVILGDAHAGSEITADGDIVIWGELRGIAHAGANGNSNAQIRAMKIEALQLRIADHIARRPDRVYYHKQQENNLPTPEVAKVHQGEIRVFKESIGIR